MSATICLKLALCAPNERWSLLPGWCLNGILAGEAQKYRVEITELLEPHPFARRLYFKVIDQDMLAPAQQIWVRDFHSWLAQIEGFENYPEYPSRDDLIVQFEPVLPEGNRLTTV